LTFINDIISYIHVLYHICDVRE